jgi:uncharacterized RDD family membrane protein YckC
VDAHPLPEPERDATEVSQAVPKYTVGGHQLAGFGIRLGAYLIDAIILALIYLVGAFGIVQAQAVGLDPIASGVLTVIFYILVIFYDLIFWTMRGATPGKMLLGLKIVTRDGGNISFGKALLRYVGYWLSSLVLLIGFFWIAFDRYFQGWHDKIASTYVIRTR